MKTIGILGGMSAASTQGYYQHLCALTQQRLGGLHSPQLLIRSLDFAPIAAAQTAGDWEGLGRLLNTEAKALQAGGAGLIVLAANTMHKVADAMMQGVDLPLVHVADATAAEIRAAGFTRPALMATAYTMEQNFYTDRLRASGVEAMIPGPADRATIHRIIFEELCRGVITDASRNTYEEIARRLADQGADCLILGCTEIGMLLTTDNSPLPVFDTLAIHCAAALEAAL